MITETSRIKLALEQAVNWDEGLILVEHHNTGFLGVLYALMKDAGKLDRLKVITFDQPELSNTYNPLGSISVRAAAAKAAKLDPFSSHAFWTDVNSYTLAAAILTLALQPGNPAFHSKDVLALLADFDLLLSYTQRIAPDESEHHQDGLNWLNASLSHWQQDGQWNFRQYKALTTGLVAKFGCFAHTPVSAVINTYTPEVDLARAIREKDIVVFRLAALNDYLALDLFDRLLMLDLEAAVATVSEIDDGFPAPTEIARTEGIVRLQPGASFIRVTSEHSDLPASPTTKMVVTHRSQPSRAGINAWGVFNERTQLSHHENEEAAAYRG